MKGKSIKKLICFTIAAMVISSVGVGCAKKEEDSSTTPTSFQDKKPEEYKGEITLWHFNKDEGPVMAENFMKKYPNVKVKYQIISQDNQVYQNKITSTLSGGSGMPDVYIGESAYVKRFVNMEGGFEDLTQQQYKLSDITKHMAKYSVDIGTDDSGKVRALSYQLTPGAIGYKRELAKQYFGTDDPDKIGEMMSTPEKLLDMARQLKEKSGGKVTFFASREEAERVYLGGRTNPWVKDGKLVIDPMVEKYVDVAKTMRDEKLESGFEQWQQPWAASISKNDSFALAIPTWGIPWIIEANDKDRKEKGGWALAKSPIPYTWGGSWVGMYSGSKNKELAWQFVKFVVSDKEGLKEWSSKVGDFINHDEIINEFASSSDVNKTVNQNVYKFFQPMLSQINGNLMTQYDDRITQAFEDNMGSYLAGKISKDDMYKNFKEKVKSDFPDLTVQ